MKRHLILLLFTILIACNSCNKKVKEPKKIIETKQKVTTSTEPKEKDKSIYDSKFLEKENVLINNHKVILTKDEFESIYTHIDSTKTRLWECGSPFEWLDEKWMTKTYGKKNKETGLFPKFNGEITSIYSQNIDFATNNHIVLFDTGSADNNTFEIISHNIKLNKDTTVKEFRSKFPNIEMEKTDYPNEVRFRFYLNNQSDDAFLFYFKDGKLNYLTLWWLLC
ncbi:hypothetical protein [Flavobacterium foetidum]|uniref:hypothetical protein n=1 Tax=Flavobacterium foetidum TaxID=2026681 RepID=UPI00107566EF|nr:hypothetical protein [Flavobacterium foetidum]KAF2513588.1 hypothetical protein E0W73_15180 [Flavobacterium foetidum]